jgi:hypothetical protein
VVVALVLALTCCSGPAPADRPRDPSPTPSASPSVTVTVEPVHELVGEGASLAAGRYRFSPFRPPLTFAVGEGWSGGHTHVEYFDVWNGEDLAIGFARPSFVTGVDGRVDVGVLSPRGALDTISGTGVDAGRIEPTAVDGRPALEMTFSVQRRRELFGGPAGPLRVEPRWRQRLITLDVEGALVLILVQSLGPASETEVDAVLSSVRFET